MKKVKLVLDTNTLISAWIWMGNEALLVEKIEEGLFIGYISPEILQELNRVLHYPKFKLSEEDINTACSYYALLLKTIKPQKSVQIINDDPDDNKFIDCALEAGADFIISGDTHLLDIGNYEGIRIIHTKDILDIC